MRVSVVIPAYNCAPYLAEAVESVLAQTRPADEVIVIDDGSTDDTPAVMSAYLPRVNYVRTANGGEAAARNKGLDLVAGDYVAFLDADDVWYPRKLEMQTRVLEMHPEVQAVCCDFSLVDQLGTVIQARHVKDKYRVFKAAGLDWPTMFPECDRLTIDDHRIDFFYGEAFSALFRGNFVNASSIIAKRSTLDQVGRFTVGRRTQCDYEFWLKLALHGPMAYIDHPLLVFRRRAGQATSRDQGLQVLRDVAEVVAQLADAARPRVGDDVVAARVAEVHRLLAMSYIGRHQPEGARRALKTAYAHRGLEPTTALLYAWSWLPARLSEGVRRSYRWLRPRTFDLLLSTMVGGFG